jgi:predicted MFS family arabinose efflux permease
MKPSPSLIALGGLLAMAAGLGVGRFVYTPILPPMVEALHLSKSEAGLIASANFVGYLLGALAAAAHLPGSRRAWLLGALAVNAVGLAAMAATQSLALFLLVRLIAGFASAFALIFASALVLDRLAAARRSGLSAVHFAGVGSGIAASAALVAILVQTGGQAGSDWRTLWLASAALALLASIAVAVLIPAEGPADQPHAASHGDAKRPPLPAGFARLAIAYGLFGFGYIITATFIVAMVRGSKEIAGLEPVIWVMFGLSAAPSVALWGRLGSRLGIRRAYALAAVVEAAGVWVSAMWINPATVIATSLLVGGTFMGLTALGLIAAHEGDGDPRRRIAVMTAAFGLGQILGPAFAGYAFDLLGSFALPSMAATLALVLSAILVLPRLSSS